MNPLGVCQVPDLIFQDFPVLKDLLNGKGGFERRPTEQLAIARYLVAEPKVVILDGAHQGIELMLSL